MTTKIRLRTKHKAEGSAVIGLAKRQASRFKRVSITDVVTATTAPRGVVPVVALNARQRPVKGHMQKHMSDPLLSEPYDWGPQGRPSVKPFRYVPGQGWDMSED